MSDNECPECSNMSPCCGHGDMAAVYEADRMADIVERLQRATAGSEPGHASWLPSLRGELAIVLAAYREARGR